MDVVHAVWTPPRSSYSFFSRWRTRGRHAEVFQNPRVSFVTREKRQVGRGQRGSFRPLWVQAVTSRSWIGSSLGVFFKGRDGASGLAVIAHHQAAVGPRASRRNQSRRDSIERRGQLQPRGFWTSAPPGAFRRRGLRFSSGICAGWTWRPVCTSRPVVPVADDSLSQGSRGVAGGTRFTGALCRQQTECRSTTATKNTNGAELPPPSTRWRRRPAPFI